MRKFIPENKKQIEIMINLYLAKARVRAEAKIADRQNTNKTKTQHTVPSFILRRIAAEDPLVAHRKSPKRPLQEYRVEYNPRKDTVKFTKNRQVFPNDYSTRPAIYNSPSFPEPSYMEYLFAVIETDAASIIDSRIANKYDLTKKRIINPYSFPHLQADDKRNKTELRIVLAAFFALQLLRPEARRESIASLTKKSGFQDVDFGRNINSLLPAAVLEIYYKQWLWFRIPNHELLVSESGMHTLTPCHGKDKERLNDSILPKAASIMPLSRRDFIYISDDSNSHLSYDDKIIYTKSSLFYRWYNSSVAKNIIGLEAKDLKTGNAEFKFASNLDANFTKEEFEEYLERCIGCAIKEISHDSRNEVFIFKDFPKIGLAPSVLTPPFALPVTVQIELYYLFYLLGLNIPECKISKN